MNKVFNWVFSGFFRTIGRVLVYILLALLLSYILKDTDFSNLFLMKVNAEWYDNIGYYPSNANIYNCTSSGCSILNNTHWIDAYYDNNVRGNWPVITTNPNQVTIATYGVVLAYYLQAQLKDGYLYLVQSYYCTSYSGQWNTFTPNLNLGGNFTQVAKTTQFGTKVQSSATTTFSDALTGNMCYLVNSLVVPDGDRQYAGLHLTASTSRTTDISFVGFDYQVIGLYDALTKSDLTDALNNSGLATASSVQDVQDGVDALQDTLDATNDAIDDQTAQQNANHQETMDTITDSDSSGASGDAGSFFSNFNTNTHGLTGIITAPLTAIQSLTSETCQPLVLPLPFVNQNLTLPCMRTIYIQYFGDFMTLYDIITLGIISYWVMVRIFGLVKDFKNPEHHEKL